MSLRSPSFFLAVGLLYVPYVPPADESPSGVHCTRCFSFGQCHPLTPGWSYLYIFRRPESVHFSPADKTDDSSITVNDPLIFRTAWLKDISMKMLFEVKLERVELSAADFLGILRLAPRLWAAAPDLTM